MTFFKKFPSINYDLMNNNIPVKITDFYRHIKPVTKYVDNALMYTYYTIQSGDRPDIVSYKLYGSSDYYWTFFVINDFLVYGLDEWMMDDRYFEAHISEKYDNKYVLEFIPPNVINNIFSIGHVVRGGISNATGTIVERNNELQQLIVDNVSGSFVDGEYIFGNDIETQFSLMNKVYDYKNAPSYFTDSNGEIVLNELYVTGSESRILNEFTYYDKEYNNNLNKRNIKIILPEYITKFSQIFKDLVNSKK